MWHGLLITWGLLALSITGQGALEAVTLRAIESVLGPVQKEASVSFVIEDAKTGERLYELNPTALRVPASVQKILTAHAALNGLGNNFCFETSLYALDEKTLAIAFGGDPSLTTANLDNLLKKIPTDKQWDTLILIDTWPALTEKMPSMMVEDMPSSYHAPISGIIVDGNYVIIRFSPNTEGGMPYIELSAPYAYKRLPGKTGDIQFRWEENVLIIEESLSALPMVVEERWSAPSAMEHAIIITKSLLSKDHSGILINWQKECMTSYPQAQLLAKHRSMPLNQTLPMALQKSDNAYFDALYLKMALQESPKLASWDEAAVAFKKFAQKTLPTISLKDWYIYDGSGVSYKNNVSANKALAVLKEALKNPALSEGLPIAGKSGTLENRFLNLKDKIQAKTGRLERTTNLAGLAKLQPKSEWNFVFFLNNGNALRDRSFTLATELFTAIERTLPEN